MAQPTVMAEGNDAETYMFLAVFVEY